MLVILQKKTCKVVLHACLHLSHMRLFTSHTFLLNDSDLLATLSLFLAGYCSDRAILQLFHSGFWRKSSACLHPHMNCQFSSRFLLVPSQTPPWQPLQIHQVLAQVLWEDVRSLLWLMDFTFFNSHVSWHPYQLDPIMFCQFQQGWTTVPD